MQQLWGRPLPAWQPPLTTRGRLLRLAATATISALSWSSVVRWEYTEHRNIFFTDLVCGLLSFACVEFRRQAPLPVALVVSALGTASSVASGPVILAIVSLATYRIPWQLILAGMASLTTTTIYFSVMAGSPLLYYELALPTAVLALALELGLGMYVGSQREAIASLNLRVRRATEDPDEVERVRAWERALIAREMQESISERIDTLVQRSEVLAGRARAGEVALGADAARLQATANDALHELREVLGVLRDPSVALAEPLPGLRDALALVARARQAGARVTMADHLDLAANEVPEPVGRAVFRLVQTILVEAARANTPVTLSLDGQRASGLLFTARQVHGKADEEAGKRWESETAGMAERVGLLGGRLSTSEQGRYRTVEAWFPWP